MDSAKLSEVVKEKPVGTRAMGRIFAEGDGESVMGEGGVVVMYFIISRDLVCQSEIVWRYSTNASFSSVIGLNGLGTAVPSLISVSAALGAEMEVRREGDVPHVLTAQEGSCERCEEMNVPVSERRSASAPSITITTPLVSRAGLVGPGFGSGGEILVRTFILFK
jgi:hypothetical protein